ncbi:MAG: AAA family ATPase, partial [Coriobacteriia bacterium]
GMESGAEWLGWVEASTDELPEPENLADVWDNMPALSPPLIDGILRQGHKLLLAGPSKAGKSYALIELCIAIAEGRDWYGWQCTKGRVLYVNLELDRASCLHRFKDVYGGLGLKAHSLENIDAWNLRGKAVPMDRLAPKLIRRAASKGYIAIVIDPIYKVITGDENSADQMAKFCNQFDLVAAELGCAVIYCHHHSKGAQGQKRSADRASGSGVFARDPDTLLDLIELELTEDIIKQQLNERTCAQMVAWLDKHGPEGWREEVPQDAQVVATAFRSACTTMLSTGAMNALIGALDVLEASVRSMTAWRIEGTLREYPRFAPVNLWFDYPVHRTDEVGVLKDLESESATPPWVKATGKRKQGAAKERVSKRQELEDAVEKANFGEAPTQQQVADYLGISKRTVQRRLRDHGGFTLTETGDDGTWPRVIPAEAGGQS